MNRELATKFLRAQLDQYDLKDWHVRLTTDITKPFLGLCSYKDKCIILNAFHVDTHPDVEIYNTIRHEVAHALTQGHNHDEIWASKAKEIGCDNTSPCASYSLSPDAIDAIRSGATLEVTFDERTEVIRTPKYKITRLQDKCEVCGKVARIQSQKEVRTSSGRKKVITYECLHVIIKDAESVSDFEDVIFDADESCKHIWGSGKNRTRCQNCNAKRLYEYQVQGCQFLEKANGRAAIFDEMGLGKTLQPLAYLKFHPELFPLLWVTKSGIKYQHGKEIIRILGEKFIPQIITSGRSTLLKGVKCYVASYDIFRRLDLEMFKEAGIKSIVLDECQAIKNPDSSRTQSIRKVVKEIPSVMPLSGTPWKNRGSEFFTVLNMLDPKRFWSFQSFKNQWVDEYWDGNKLKEGGIRNPAKFKEFISDLAIRRERTEVMPELPLINRTRLISEVPEHARKVYKEEEDNLIKNYNQHVIDGTEDSFDAQKELMQSLIVMRQIVGIAKVPATVEFAQEFLEDTDRKLAIFVHHKSCGELITKQMMEYCATNNIPQPLVLTADLSAEERFKVAENFNGPNYRLLIASTLASGEGLNLQTCSDCIIHERQWNPANEEQAEGRFIRIGQTAQSVTATYVHGDGTVDMTLDGIVEKKRAAFHSSMNNGELPTWNEQGIIKELIQSIVNNRKK